MKKNAPSFPSPTHLFAGAASFFTLLIGCASAPLGTESAASVPATVDKDQGHEEEAAQIRLVLWITVDQMRGDYLQRYESQLSPGGFRRLMDSGVWYQDAHYGHAITETAPGHATLFTGASPQKHGIIGNSWLIQGGEEITSVSDPDERLLAADGAAPSPSKKGASPRRLLSPTLGEEMKRASAGKSHVVALSTKDRSAILPAGQNGQAFWMGGAGFVTSTYYEDQTPEWLARHHQEHPPESYLREGWPLLKSEGTYKNPPSASPSPPSSWTAGFPHAVAAKAEPNQAVIHSPWGDRAVLDLARSALSEFALGSDGYVDLLSLSFSSPDIIGHAYGPESREMEDCLLRLDEGLAELFSQVEREIGWDRVLIVLSADHGGAESPQELVRQGLPGGRLTEGQLEARARKVLKAKFGHDRFLLGVSSPYVNLDEQALAKEGKTASEVAQLLIAPLADVPGVFGVYPKGAQEFADLPPADAARLTQALHPERSGHLYVVPDKYTLFLQDEDIFATHGSPWSYDTHVPVVLAGGQLSPEKVQRHVDVRSLAPTVAHLIGVPAPRDATFAVLTEAVSKQGTKGEKTAHAPSR